MRDIGTAHPTNVEAVDPEGRWIVLCQARRDTNKDGRTEVNLGMHGDFYGDDMEPYLMAPDGPGERLDSFVDSSSTGRHLVFIAKRRLILLDTVTGTRTDLSSRGANLLDDGYPGGPNPLASFDPQGTRLLYLRRSKKGLRPVLRELNTGNERILDHGGGRLWRAAIVDDGWAVGWVRPPGARPMQLPRTSLAARGCRGPIGIFSTSGGGENGPIRRLIPIGGGPPVDDHGFIELAGHSLLRRLDDGTIVWERDSRQRSVVPATCGGLVMQLSKEGGPLLVACSKLGKPAPVFWFGETTRPLDLKVDISDEYVRRGRIWGRYQEQGTDVVDLDRGVLQKLPIDVQGVSSYGDKELFCRDEYPDHYPAWTGLIDWRTGNVSTLGVACSIYADTATGGRWVAFGPFSKKAGPVVDMTNGAVVGSVDGPPLALTTRGWVLMAPPGSVRPRMRSPTFSGPLRWHRPTPPS